MSIPCDSFKVGIVGCGKVGMTAAFAIALQGVATELVLLSRSVDKIIGEELDLEHGMSFMSNTQVHATERYEDLAGCDVVVVTAGAAQRPGETRLDLVAKNSAIMADIIPRIVKNAPDCVILMVTNPVDVLTYQAYQLAGWPKGRIFGSGTVLDTSRFRFHLSEFLHVNPKSIHAYILGEHGDHSFPVISSASIGGQPLSSLSDFSHERAKAAYEKARTAAYKIIESKGATFYAIGVVVAEIVKNILRDNKSIMPVSVPLHGYYDHYGVALSVPCVIGRQGAERSLDIKLDWQERQQLDQTVSVLKQYLR